MGNTPDESSSGNLNPSPEVKEIQEEFSLPVYRAQKWKQYIGDLGTIKEEFRRSTSDAYISLILKREQLLSELAQRRDELRDQLHQQLTPLRDWRSTKLESLDPELSDEEYAGLIRDIREEHNRRCEVVKRYFESKDDEETILIKWELAELDRELCEVYRAHLKQTTGSELTSKKDRIVELKREFPYLRVSNDLVATVVNTTRSYAQQIKYIPGEGVRDRQVPTRLRNRTLERDNHSCVRCGATEKLEAHHILPRDRGGEDSLENIATLCSACHQDIAHGQLPYDSRTEFWTTWANAEEPNQ